MFSWPFGFDWSWLQNIFAGLGNLLLSLLQYLLNEVLALVTWLLNWLASAIPVFPVSIHDVSYAIGFVITNTHMVQILTAWNYYCCLNVAIAFAATALIAEGFASTLHVLRFFLSKLPFIGGAE